MPIHSLPKLLVGLIPCCFLLSCVPATVLKPHPPGREKELADTAKAPITVSAETAQASRDSAATLDFALAIIDSEPAIAGSDTSWFEFPPIEEPAPAKDTIRIEPRESLRYPNFPVGSKKVRVLLQEKMNRCVVYSIGRITFADGRGGKDNRGEIRGRIVLESTGNGRFLTAAFGSAKQEVALPCTLHSVSDYNFIEFDDKSFRGSIIAAPSERGAFAVLNFVDVEDYLRGVVPLELGIQGKEEFEALKAQAIAARTYTYKKIQLQRGQAYDVLTGVADQVYGGTAVESSMSDMAIRYSKDLIMVYHDTLVFAYYHSTCGGRTANVKDVWEKPSQPYLVTVLDKDSNGRSYCAESSYFDWVESWPNAKLVSLIRTYATDPQVKGKMQGTIENVVVDSRFACGRISSLRIETSSGAYRFGGDKLRSALRRNASGAPILKSSNFSVEKVTPQVVKIQGRGYGHGVGMCQMGALGRARAGQGFEQILEAYYHGVEIKTAVQGK